MLSAVASRADAQMHVHGGANIACADTSLACATAATPAFGPDGSLWLVWAAGGRVSVAHSTDGGASFGAAVVVNQDKIRIDNGPDARPKIVVDAMGRITVAYGIFKDEAYNGEAFFARSTDGGKSFSTPVPLTDDTASQRFEALALDSDGRLFAAWIDKRAGVAAKRQGRPYVGAALAFAWLESEGATVPPARIAQENTCECCRLGIAFAGKGQPAVLFRNVFDGGVRDHAIMTFADPATPGPVYRVSVDDWRIDACPHQGPSLSIGPAGTYHAAWFTEGSVRQGLFYARSTDGGRTFSTPLAIGTPDRQPSRPQVLALHDAVLLAWKEFDGERATVSAMMSRDDGATWSAPKTVAATGGASDHPLLIGVGDRVFLSWLTHREGYRLLPLEIAR
jgi:hypothetical protein